jgi:predicted GNAT superfamily acetyltransferase
MTTLPLDFVVRPATAADLAAVLVLNNASVPHMNALSAAELDQIVAMSNHFTVAEDSQGILGALLCLPQGTAYWSAHYQWFGERYDTFTYVDRVMVAERAKRRGVGRALYDDRAGSEPHSAEPSLDRVSRGNGVCRSRRTCSRSA